MLKIRRTPGRSDSLIAIIRRMLERSLACAHTLANEDKVETPNSLNPLTTQAGTGMGYDERGSVIALVNDSNTVTTINKYDDYGVPASGNAGRFQYTGQAWLPEIGTHYYKARMYIPQLGRFMQTDPIGVAGGINLYAYVGGDPINKIDPFGFSECDGTLLADGSCDGTLVVTAAKSQILPSAGSGSGDFLIWYRHSLEDYRDPFAPQVAPECNILNNYCGPIPVPVPQNGHRYVIQQDTTCSASGAFEKLRAPGVSAPGAPYARSGTTPRINLPINNPISQSVNPATRTIRNVTLEGHSFYPGSVTIQVEPRAGGGSSITIIGEGSGPNPGLNDAAGYAIFGFAARSVAQSCAGQPTYTPVRGG